MDNKELRKMIKQATYIFIIFHELYMRSNKTYVHEVLRQYPDKNDWQASLIDGTLFIE